MRCSTVAGFHGRSKSTSRRQNSKLRPSPPASVDTSRLGPSGLRKSATSVSRRAGRQLFVECASCQLRAVTERRAQHFQRFAVCDENERLLVGVLPAPRLCEQPREAGVRAFIASACSRSARSSGPRTALSAAPDASPRRTRSIFLRCATASTAGAGSKRRFDLTLKPPAGRVLDRDRNSHSRRQSADVGSARRAGAWRQGGSRSQPCFKAHTVRKLLRAQQLQQPEEPVRIVFERRRAEEQYVTTEAGDWRDGSPRGFTWMAGRAP